jgi:[protein-PII] uridylyltransferase
MEQRLTLPFFDPDIAREKFFALWHEHGAVTSEFRQDMLAYIKDLIQKAREVVKKDLESDGNGRRCARTLSDFQDELIRLIYDFVTTHVYVVQNPSESERMSILATGGYGRQLLAPHSDIDLLFLLPYKQTAWGESIAEFILYTLWDSGFKVGYATRSIEQTVRFAKTDITTRTALLDSRHIVGDEALWESFHSRFREQILAGDRREFTNAKLDERNQRIERAGGSRYRVEPNIKEGKGGLRDLHTLYWIAKYINPDLTSENFVEMGVFSKPEYRMYRRCEDFLWTVRCHLHFLADKPEERLSFDIQIPMAERLHYHERPGMMAVERFMKHYFLIAKDVGDLTRILCAGLEVKQLKGLQQLNKLSFLRPLAWRTRARISATTDFRVENGRLTIKNKHVFRSDPLNLIRMFALADRSNIGFHPEVLRLARHSLHLIDDSLRANWEANQLFVEVLTSRSNPEITLRRMNETGVLGRFIPDFGRVVSMMQFNMYHHYTVDEHLLRTIGILAEIEKGSLEDELPLSTEIIGGIENRRALYLATFLHDVAKGRQEDHSIAGARVAREIGPRLGFSTGETSIAAWLVENHLVMSQFAQSRDLNDPKTIRDFANIVQSPELLMLLVILTAADIRAVGPGVWTGWKGQLLRNLYAETEPRLTGGYTSAPREARVRQALSEFRKELSDWSSEEIEAFTSIQDNSYWLRTDLSLQVAHAGLVRQAKADHSPFAFEVSSDEFTALSELRLWTKDRSGLVAKIAGACAAANANIVSANLTTTRDNMALNSIFLHRTFEKDSEELEYLSRIGKTIEQALNGEQDLAKILAKKERPQPRLDAFTVEPRITIDNSLSDELTVIEVNARDRAGLLYDIAHVLADMNVDISSAYIATFGEKAVDVFYVTDTKRKKIIHEGTRRRIKKQLLIALDSNHQGN